jgi:hypothetical protein
MRQIFRWAHAAALLTLCAGAAHAQAPIVYHDAETGVSFSYSQEWRPLNPETDTHYLRPAIQPVHTAIVLDTNPPAPYTGTDFTGLAFSYAIGPQTTAAACTAAITLYGAAAARPAATINGRRFTAAEGGDAAMSHQIYERLYSTFANGRCYVFDLALTTGGFGARDDVRQMSQAERDDAARKLDAIFGTVRIATLPQ